MNKRAAELELVGMVLVALTPLIPYFAFVLAGVDRFSVSSDLALTEYLIRRVWSGDILVGMPSRFHWSHPGPLFFYVNAPFVSLFGKSCTGMYVGVCTLVAAEVSFVVVPLRRIAGRAHAMAAVVVLVAWFGAFGNISANPWERLTITLPLVTFMVCASLFAAGSTRTLAPAVFFGALASETHIATVPLVALVLAGAAGAFVVAARKLERADRISIGVALALGLLVSLPPLIEQCIHPTGNITLLLRFFRERTEPFKSFDETLASWVNVNAWLPDRLMTARILDDGGIPYMMSWDPMPIHASQTAWTILVTQLIATSAAGTIAYRRKDRTSLALIGVGVLGWAAAFYGIRSIIGPVQPSLVFWASAPSTILWLGTLAALFDAAREKLQPRAWHRHALVAVALFGVALTTGLQRAWLARVPIAPGSHAPFAAIHRQIYEMMREKERQDGFVPVMHLTPGDWELVHFLILEHAKDGADIRIGDDTLWTYPGGPSAAGAVHPLHIWIADRYEVPFTACLKPIVSVGEIVVYGSEHNPPCVRGRMIRDTP
jgi:hypothetical protein